MQVVQTAGVPPNQGKIVLLITGWTWKTRNAPIRIVEAKHHATHWGGWVWEVLTEVLTFFSTSMCQIRVQPRTCCRKLRHHSVPEGNIHPWSSRFQLCREHNRCDQVNRTFKPYNTQMRIAKRETLIFTSSRMALKVVDWTSKQEGHELETVRFANDKLVFPHRMKKKRSCEMIQK